MTFFVLSLREDSEADDVAAADFITIRNRTSQNTSEYVATFNYISQPSF